MLVPFGVGSRKCPADKLSLYVFKYFILYFVKMVKSYKYTEIELKPASAMKARSSKIGLFAKETHPLFNTTAACSPVGSAPQTIYQSATH